MATEALGAIVSTLFDNHHMHRVFAQVDDRNTAVCRHEAEFAQRGTPERGRKAFHKGEGN